MLSETRSPEERKIIQILDYFASQEEAYLVGETFSLDTIITIPQLMKGDSARAYASFRGGSNRKYKIQTIKKFLYNIYNNPHITEIRRPITPKIGVSYNFCNIYLILKIVCFIPSPQFFDTTSERKVTL